MTVPSPEAFTILPINLPQDLPDLRVVVTDAFGENALAGDIARDLKTIEARAFAAQLREIRQRNGLEGRNKHGMRSVAGKVVLVSSGEPVGVVCLLVPGDGTESAADFEPLPLIREGQVIPEGGQTAFDAWNTNNNQMEALSEKIMGPDRAKHWWYLSVLAVSPEYQRMGLGGRLLRWGIEQARKDIEARKHLEIKGMWLVAAEAGLKTYLKEGMTVVGDGWLGAKSADENNGKETQGRHFTWLTLKM